MTNGESSTKGRNETFTGNRMDFRGSGRSSGTTHDGGEFQNTPLPNASRNDYQFIGRHQNHPGSSTEEQKQEDRYGYDTVVVGSKRPRGGQDMTLDLGSAGGINEDNDSQGHVADMTAISGDMLSINTTGQGHALDSEGIHMDDDMAEGTGREGSEEVHLGEGAHGVLKMGLDEGQGQTSTWSETKTKVCYTYFIPEYSSPRKIHGFICVLMGGPFSGHFRKCHFDHCSRFISHASADNSPGR